MPRQQPNFFENLDGNTSVKCQRSGCHACGTLFSVLPTGVHDNVFYNEQIKRTIYINGVLF